MPTLLRSPATLLAIVLGLVGLTVVLYAWRLPPFATTLEMTEDAYVRGQVTVLAPLVAGHVAEVPVQDYQAVKAGDVLVRLDDRTLRGGWRRRAPSSTVRRRSSPDAESRENALTPPPACPPKFWTSFTV